MKPYIRAYDYTTVLRSSSTGPNTLGNYVTTTASSTVTAPARSQSGFENPAWLSMRAQFMEAGTAYVGTGRYIQTGRGSVYCSFLGTYPGKPDSVYTRTEGGQLLRGAIFSSPSSALDSQVQNLARTRANNKISEFIRPFQGGVFLGELREALSMVRHPLLSLRRGIDTYLEVASARARYVRVSNEAKRRRAREKILSNVWLEYVFGWRPFLSDIESFVDALAQNNYFAANRTVIRTGAKDQRLDNAGFGNLNATVQQTFAGSAACMVTRRAVLKTSVKLVVGVEVSRKSNQKVDPTLFGFSWNEFAPTVWELIPYSFLADYFTNIGDVIASYSIMPGVIKWADESILRNWEYSQSGYYYDQGTRDNLGILYRGGGGSPGTLVCRSIELRRTAGLTTLAVVPQVRFPTSWTRLLNIAALAENHRRARTTLNS